MIITAKDYRTAKEAVKEVLRSGSRTRLISGDTVVIFVDKQARTPEIDYSTDNQVGKIGLYKKYRRPAMIAELGNVSVAMDELYRKKGYLFDNPSGAPVVISLNSVFNDRANRLHEFTIF